MKTMGKLIPVLTILCLLPACVSTSTSTVTVAPELQTATSTQPTYADPFAYCAAKGTLDTVDSSYTGEAVPDGIVNGYKTAAGLDSSTEPMDVLKQGTTWRCMDGKVYACNVGANLPCDSKSDTSKTPTQPMSDYCTTNPDADSIPMSVTGHATVYEWHCNKTTPEVVKQVEDVDAAGFIANIWYKIDAAPSGVPTAGLSSRQILFASNRGGDYSDLYLLDLSNGEVKRLTDMSSNTFPGNFSPDGSQFVFTGSGLTNSYIGVMKSDGSDPVNLTNADYDEGSPSWSPDGTKIAFTSRRDGNNEIYLTNVGGTWFVQLTQNPRDDFDPSWSPDGQQIVFSSDRDRDTGIYSLYIMSADGSNVKKLTYDQGSDYSPSWSPDGTKIAFRLTQNGTSDIYVVNADGSNPVQLTRDAGDNWSPSWSPDGTKIAFQSNRDGNWEIYVMNADGSDPVNATHNPADDQMPFWAK